MKNHRPSRKTEFARMWTEMGALDLPRWWSVEISAREISVGPWVEAIFPVVEKTRPERVDSDCSLHPRKAYESEANSLY